jgi:hypothetical protein
MHYGEYGILRDETVRERRGSYIGFVVGYLQGYSHPTPPPPHRTESQGSKLKKENLEARH